MGYHEIGTRTTNATIDQASLEIIGSTVIQARLLEIFIQEVAGSATAPTIGLGRPAAAGVTPTTPITIIGEDANDAPTTKIATAWGTSPTAPTVYMRRWSPGTPSILSTVTWRFWPGILIDKSGAGNSLTLHNIAVATNLVYEVWLVVDEE